MLRVRGAVVPLTTRGYLWRPSVTAEMAGRRQSDGMAMSARTASRWKKPERRAITKGKMTMRLTIDIRGVQFFCTREAQARTDRDTGAPKVDRETGEAQWQVQVAALDATGGEVLAVTVAGRPEVAVGSPVVVEGLVAIPWHQGDRSGVAYKANSIRSGGSSVLSAVPAKDTETPTGKRAA